MRCWMVLGIAVAMVTVGCSDSGRPRVDGGLGDGGVSVADEDGDGISDADEGRSANTDTDADGTPDYLDDDSDGDGIPDSVEAGDADPATPPEDADGDGVPNFRDNDSDGNGIDDFTEGTGDSDGDGREDFRDTDDDDDRVLDVTEIGDPLSPSDFDGDGLPDFRDPDSDNDGILDGDERPPVGPGIDTDGDASPDWQDADSDGDGWTDSEEAGDADIRTAPFDTDGDTIPDFRDADSDGDGLSDAVERDLGTSRTSADTDGDGVSDLVEVAACPPGDATCAMDALDPTSSPRARGDFVFFEPYAMPPLPMRDTLDFATDIRVADVYFLVDTTGSMGGAITNVRTSLSTPASGIIDQVRAMIPDTWFGVGGFDDYQVAPYGYASSGDRAYYHLQDITGDAATAQAGVNMLATHYGGDGPESLVPALHATVSGLGLPGMSGWTGNRADGYGGFAACAASMSVGWPCFRTGAVPIVVAITDIDSHNGPGGANTYTVAGASVAPDYTTTVAAATAARVRVIGVAVGGGGRTHLEALARDTGAVDGAGLPLVSTAASGAVSSAVVDQIRTLANATRFDINVLYNDDTSDMVDTWAAFVDHIEANTAGDAARGCDPRAADDTDGDTYPDTFRDVESGTRVCFDIIVKQNDTVMSLTTPQLFRATLQVLGDGFTPLDERDVFFLVPPEVLIGPPI